jgi:uncharacterized protein (TIGR02186 family)
MRAATCIAGLLAALLALPAAPARADDLVSGLSQDQIEITSNYTGTDLVVFGAIESRNQAIGPAPRDVVVVVRGPDVTMTVRQKDRVAGLWINRHEVTLTGMPGYYYLASTRPLDKIAAKPVLARYQLGLANLMPSGYSTHSAMEAQIYANAAVRQQARAGLYQETAKGIDFLSYSLFRVRVPVPAGVPRGQYTAEVFLFQNGNVVSAQSTPLFVDQIGLERRLFGFAHQWPLAYGVATVLMALLLGWISSFVFRRQ